MTGVEIHPAVLCLLASLIWAPAVYVIASRLDRGQSFSASEMIWLGALFIAALPTLIAPALDVLGVSLRPIAAAPTAAAAEIAMAHEASAAPSLPVLTSDLWLAAPGPLAAPIAANAEAAKAAFAPAISADLVVTAAALLYLYGVFLFAGLAAIRAAIFAGRLRDARPADLPGLAAALDAWRRRFGLAKTPAVKRTHAVSSVCVYGLFRPTILIPEELDARVSTDELVMMCAHELAHIRRGDAKLFAALAAARIFFWFNPFVRRIAARAELAAEQSADQLVLAAGADRRAYAACFVESLRFAAERARPAPLSVPSFTPFDRRSRRMRLDAILSGGDGAPQRRSRLAVAAATGAALFIAFGQAALAVRPEAPRADDPDTDAFVVAAATAVSPGLGAMPVEGRISLGFGETYTDRDGVAHRGHQGVDIRAPRGAEVRAPADGVVIEATDLYKGQPAWGKVVVIEHEDGLVTRYAHLDSYAVKAGQRVRAGEKIAEVGATGRVSGPHLHFETLVDGAPVDPIALLGVAEAPLPPAAPKPAAAPAPIAPRPGAAPTPAAPAAPPAPHAWSSQWDDALEGARSPAAPPAPAPGAAPFAFFFDEDGGFRIASAGDAQVYTFNVTKDGEKMRFAFNSDEGFTFDFGDTAPLVFRLDGERGLSPEDRARFEDAMERMRAALGERQFARLMQGFKLSPGMVALRGMSEEERAEHEKRMVEIRKRAEEIRADVELRHAEIAERVRDAAEARRRIIERSRITREQTRADAEEDRERLRAERDRLREQAHAERDRLRAERERLREEARALAREAHERSRFVFKHSDMDEAQMLELREKALAEAEKSLKAERAEIERMKKKLREKKDGKDGRGE